MALKDHEIAELINETTLDLSQKLNKAPFHLRQIVSVAIVNSLSRMDARTDHPAGDRFHCKQHGGIGVNIDCRVCTRA